MRHIKEAAHAGHSKHFLFGLWQHHAHGFQRFVGESYKVLSVFAMQMDINIDKIEL